MSKHQVMIGLDLPEGTDQPHACSNEELATAMKPEVQRFDQWFRRQGNEQLTGIERSILRTYLAWKFLYEKGDLDSPAGGRTDG